MTKLCILILSTVCYTACSLPAATPQWNHTANPDPIQMERDLGDCRMYLDAAQESGSSPPHRQVQEWDDEFIECMAERGWTPVPIPHGARR